MNRIAAAIVCVGLGAIALYGDMYEQHMGGCWFGCFIAFLCATG